MKQSMSEILAGIDLATGDPFDEAETYAPVGTRTSEARLDRRPLGDGHRQSFEPGLQDGEEVGPEAPGLPQRADPTNDRSVEAILAARAKTHGDFTDNARVMQALKAVVHVSPNWNALTDVQREALHMILHKVGRICSGDPNIRDHWDDIAGYAKLASERIQ